MRPDRRGVTLVELVVVIAIVAVLAGLTLSAVQRMRSRAAALGCQNHLRQIGLALGNYHAAHERFPTGVTGVSGPDGAEFVGWLTRLLPYVEQDSVWREAVAAAKARPSDFTAAPPHPLDVPITVFGCPADGRVREPVISRETVRVALGSYLGVAGTRHAWENGVFYRSSRVRLADINDGTSNTLAAGERPPSPDLWYGWWYAGRGVDGRGTADAVLGVRERAAPTADPTFPECNGRPAKFGPGDLGSMCDARQFWSLHTGGAHFLFCDGSARFLPYSAEGLLPAMATRAGGEAVSMPD